MNSSNNEIENNLIKILSSSSFLSFIYSEIMSLLEETKKLDTNSVCIIDSGDNLSRFTASCKTNFSTKEIAYNKNDLIVIGGSAYILHLENIKDFFERNKTNNAVFPSNLITNNKTHDIDMVWWPKITGPDTEIFLSKSKALANFSKDLADKLRQWANTLDFSDLLNNILYKNNSKPFINKNNFLVTVTNSDDMARGIHVITLSFKINSNFYKIMEIMIHDGGSSQSTTTILPMTSNTVYSNETTTEKINNVNVIKFSSFIRQQKIAYNNLKNQGNLKKAEVIFDRLNTLKKLINTITLNIDNSKLNLKDSEYYLDLLNEEIMIHAQKGGLRKTKKKGHQLFNDNPRGNPRTRGIGYGTAKKARNSITRLKGKSKTYKRQVATTMYYRAKHHKYQNQGMRNAMKIWKKYINQLKK